jgi:hypothetical protein
MSILGDPHEMHGLHHAEIGRWEESRDGGEIQRDHRGLGAGMPAIPNKIELKREGQKSFHAVPGE